jgi:ubiquinone/menaquinone biosynthesis C-methylase UbiE
LDEEPYAEPRVLPAVETGPGYAAWAESYDEPGNKTIRLEEGVVIGVDSSAQMLERAAAKVPGATFVLGDLDRLPLEDRAVDAAVCALALSHLPDLRPAVGELARVLRPGGRLIVATRPASTRSQRRGFAYGAASSRS